MDAAFFCRVILINQFFCVLLMLIWSNFSQFEDEDCEIGFLTVACVFCVSFAVSSLWNHAWGPAAGKTGCLSSPLKVMTESLYLRLKMIQKMIMLFVWPLPAAIYLHLPPRSVSFAMDRCKIFLPFVLSLQLIDQCIYRNESEFDVKLLRLLLQSAPILPPPSIQELYCRIYH